jgi:hypothetical protein
LGGGGDLFGGGDLGGGRGGDGEGGGEAMISALEQEDVSKQPSALSTTPVCSCTIWPMYFVAKSARHCGAAPAAWKRM